MSHKKEAALEANQLVGEAEFAAIVGRGDKELACRLYAISCQRLLDLEKENSKLKTEATILGDAILDLQARICELEYALGI